MKPICCHCHFLAKAHREENTGRVLVYSLSQQEREKAKTEPEEAVAAHYSLKCHMGVWDEGVSGSPKERHFTVNVVDRASACFFFPHNTAMLFDAARELQKRSAENEQLKRSNFYTRIGLWIAAGALAVSVLVEYLENV